MHSSAQTSLLALAALSLFSVTAAVNYSPSPILQPSFSAPVFSVSLYTSNFGSDFWPYLSSTTTDGDGTRTRTRTRSDTKTTSDSFFAQTTNAGNDPSSTSSSTSATPSAAVTSDTSAAALSSAASSVQTSSSTPNAGSRGASGSFAGKGGEGLLGVSLALGLFCLVGSIAL